MAYVSLESSIRTCRPDPGWGEKLYSDRYFDPNKAVCPIRSGRDVYGRPVCIDSYNTKTAGCNNASDRVIVENGHRPKYFEYVNLNANGLAGNICRHDGKKPYDTVCRTNSISDAYSRTGNAGNVDVSQYIYPNCIRCSQKVPKKSKKNGKKKKKSKK